MILKKIRSQYSLHFMYSKEICLWWIFFVRDIFACILYFQKYYQHCHSHILSGIARVLLLISIFIKAYFTPAKFFLQPFFLLIFSLSFLPLVNLFSSNFFLVLYSFASLLPPQSLDQRARVFLLLVTCVQRLWLACYNNYFSFSKIWFMSPVCVRVI